MSGVDFSVGFVDFDCTLRNPAIALALLVAALLVAPALVWALLRTRAPRLLLLGGAWLLENLLAGLLTVAGLQAELFHDYGSSSASIGCISSAPWWHRQGTLVLASAAFGTLSWLVMRRRERRQTST